MHDSSRRIAIQKLVGMTASLALPGCCCVQWNQNHSENLKWPSRTIPTILKPAKINANPLKNRYAVDAHAHFFNGSDVNVKGYLEECVAHSKGVAARAFLTRIGGIAQLTVDLFAPSARQEYEILTGLIDKDDAPFISKKIYLQNLNDKLLDKAAIDFASRLAKEGLESTIINEEKAFRLEHKLPQLLNNPTLEDIVRDAFGGAPISGGFFENSSTASAELVDSTFSPIGVIRFLGRMLSYRFDTLRRYSETYSEGDKAFGIDAVFGALVDFDWWLEGTPKSSRRDQMMLHSLLSSMSGGYMLPLISYNPWTDIKCNGASLALVEEAIEKYGFIGVKIYPPVGYLPFENAANLPPSRYPRPSNLNQLDACLNRFYERVAALGVPIMAHTGESMGRDKGDDENSSPDAWERLLTYFDAQQKPSLCIDLGHFGGDVNKKGAGGGASWTKGFAELARDHPKARLYGDIGYWEGLASCDGDGCSPILNRLREALMAYPEIGRRIMYGSDYFMLVQEAGWERYPQKIIANIQKELGNQLSADALLYANPMSCFGLDRAGRRREVVISHLRTNTGLVPAWLEN